ncbi:hypothetical protein C0995_015771 [Termitomyces sp. Mi166|nr:hypothetical protein C0995_015771 [Termitomyces sp. Mi166\
MVYKVADISLAAFGRKEIEIAEVRLPTAFFFPSLTIDQQHEMPGLMYIRAKVASPRPRS